MVEINQKFLIKQPHKRESSSAEVRYICPVCDKNNKYHLYVNFKKGVYYCMKCHLSGRLSKNIEIPDLEDLVIKKRKIYKGGLPDGVLPFSNNEGAIEKRVYKYLIGRGFTDSDISYYNIHYGAKGKFLGHAVFPFIQGGEVVYYVARIAKNKLPEGRRKTLNPPGPVEIYNIESAAEAGEGEIVITEGVIDAIMTGLDAVAVLGKNVSEHQLEVLQKYGIHSINILLDSVNDDNTARDSAEKMARTLYGYFDNIKILDLPFGDPGSVQLRKIKNVKSWKGILKEVKYKPFKFWKGLSIRRS